MIPVRSEAIVKFSVSILVIFGLATPALADWATLRQVYESPTQPSDDTIGAAITALNTHMEALEGVDMSGETEDLRDFQVIAYRALSDQATALQHYGEVLSLRHAFEAQVKDYQDQLNEMHTSGYQRCEAQDGTNAPDTYCKMKVDQETDGFADLFHSWFNENAPGVEAQSRSVAEEMQQARAQMEAVSQDYQRLIAQYP